MKKIARILRWALLAAALLILAALAGRNFLIKHGASAAVKSALGLDLRIADVDVGLFESRFRIEGLSVSNPEGFGSTPLAQVPLIYVDYEVLSLLENRLHCTEIELDVQEVSVVRNAAGELNLNRIKAIAEGSGKKEEAPPPEGEPMEMQIDRLVLTVGQVKHIEIGKDGAAKETVYAIGLDHEVFENLTSPGEIVRLVVLRAVKAAGLKNLGLAVDALGEGLKHVGGKGMEALESLGEGLKEGAGKIGEGAKGLFDRVKEGLGGD